MAENTAVAEKKTFALPLFLIIFLHKKREEHYQVLLIFMSYIKALFSFNLLHTFNLVTTHLLHTFAIEIHRNT
jgi:hypothetical protein